MFQEQKGCIVPVPERHRFSVTGGRKTNMISCLVAVGAMVIASQAGAQVNEPPGCNENALATILGPTGPVCLISPVTDDFSVVTYNVTVGVPNVPGACNIANLDVYFWPPNNPPADPNNLSSPASLLNATLLNPSDLDLEVDEFFLFDPGINAILTYQINPADIVGGTISAYVLSIGTSLTGKDDQAVDERVITKTVHAGEIAIAKEASVDRICEDVPQEVTYTYTVTNTGNRPLTNVVVSDPHCTPVPPVGQTPADTLPVGGVWIFSCTTTVDDEVTNIASVTANTTQLGCPVDEAFSNPVTVTVNAPPDCFIDGPEKVVCEGTHEYCGPAGMVSYSWNVEGDGEIVGADDGECIDVLAHDVIGSYTVSLHIVDDKGCENSCEEVVDVNCPKGACCIDPSMGDCVDGIFEEDCDEYENGTFFEGLTCKDPEVVEFCQILGACCIDPATGDCEDGLFAHECDALNGTFFAGLTCRDEEVAEFCRIPGACCIDPATEHCVDDVELDECKDLGGTFFAELTCDDQEVIDYCREPGACCIDPATEDCVDDVTASECEDLNGTFFVGATCDDAEVVAFCSDDPGGEGCTPGFWMQPHHCGHWPCHFDGDNWVGICPDGCPGGPATGTTWAQMGLSTAGGIINGNWTLDHVMRPPGQMKQQLGIEPGQLRSLIFHTIAALLNAGNDDVAFGMSVQGVVDNFNDAVAAWLNDGDVSHLLSAKNIVADLNEQGCPLGGHADLAGPGMEVMEDGYVDMYDLLFLIGKWNSSNERADLNEDGLVDIFDLIQLLTNWGPQVNHWNPSLD